MNLKESNVSKYSILGLLFFSLIFVTMGSATAQTTIDDFEDGDLSEYSGTLSSTNGFSVTTNNPYSGTYSLEENEDSGALVRAYSTSGLPEYPGNDSRYIYRFQIDSSTDSPNQHIMAFLFGFQDVDNYFQATYSPRNNEVAINKVKSGSFTTVNSKSTTVNPLTDQWIRAEIEWYNNGTINAKWYNDSDDSLLAEVEGTDTDFQSNKGIGFLTNNGDNTGNRRSYFDLLEYESLDQPTTTVNFSNFQPADGSTYDIDDQINISVDVRIDRDGNTTDVEGIYNGNIEKVFTHPGDNSTQTYEFSIDPNNTGSFNYRFSAITDSPNGTFLKDTETRTLNVQSDPVTFNLNEPTNGEKIVKASPNYTTDFEFNLTGSENEDADFKMITQSPSGNQITQVDSVIGANVTLSYDTPFEIGNETGVYNWWVEATGQQSGEVSTSANYSFRIKPENFNLSVIDPSTTTDQLENFDSLDFTTASDSDPWIGQSDSEWDVDWSTDVLTDQVSKTGRTSGLSKSIVNNRLKLEATGQQISSGADNLVAIWKYNNTLKLEDDTHWFNASVPSVSQGFAMSWNATQFLEDGRTGDYNVKFEYQSGSNSYDIIYDDGSNTYTLSTNYDKGDNIEWGIGVGVNGLVTHNVEIDSVDTDAKEITATGVNRSAYVDNIPYKAELSLETENDKNGSIEFIHNGKLLKTTEVKGDSVTRTYTHNETFSNTLYGKYSRLAVKGSEDQFLGESSLLNVTVVQSPEFNLSIPKDGKEIELEEDRIDEDNREASDNTRYTGYVEVGEAGTGIIKLRRPNKSYNDIITRDFNRSDVGSIWEITGSKLIDNIQLNENFDEGILESDNYTWSMAFEGDDSEQRFDLNSNNYTYVSEKDTIVGSIIGYFSNLNDRIKREAGSTGQFFIATILILLLTGVFYEFIESEIIAISTMVLGAFGFSIADGYYPIGVFWILTAVVGLAGAYFGGKTLGGD